jgi:hypothetical protein
MNTDAFDLDQLQGSKEDELFTELIRLTEPLLSRKRDSNLKKVNHSDAIKLLVLKIMNLGYDPQSIGKRTGIHPGTISSWRARYEVVDGNMRRKRIPEEFSGDMTNERQGDPAYDFVPNFKKINKDGSVTYLRLDDKQLEKFL